tara:strand:- start:106 stop:927 length:822 start_codon:yes stop_codon:yes gene_type:complete
MIIYTCITNGYDTIPNHYYDSEVQYVCFTDGTVDVPSPWEERPIPIEHECPRRLSAYAKINPHKLFPDGSQTVWIDGCYVMTKEYVEWCKNIFTKHKRTHMRHFFKFTYIEEVMEGYVASFNTYEDVMEITNTLKELGYNFRKYCSPVLASIWRTVEPEMYEFHDLWWKYSLIGPNRDQISFDTARQLTKLEWNVHEPRDKGVWPEVGIDFENKVSRNKLHPQAGHLDQYKNTKPLLEELQKITRLVYKLNYRHKFDKYIQTNVISPTLPRTT